MSISTTKSAQVLGNPNLCRAILDFAPTCEQDRCKRVSRALRQNAEVIQQRKIFKLLSPEAINCLGRNRLEQAKIFNIPVGKVYYPKDFPSSFVIGLQGEKTAYISAKVKILVSGRSCLRCCSLKVSEGMMMYMPPHQQRDEYLLISALLKGKAIEHSLAKEEEIERRCCFSTRIFSCFRRCFFQTPGELWPPVPCKIKLD